MEVRASTGGGCGLSFPHGAPPVPTHTIVHTAHCKRCRPVTVVLCVGEPSSILLQPKSGKREEGPVLFSACHDGVQAVGSTRPRHPPASVASRARAARPASRGAIAGLRSAGAPIRGSQVVRACSSGGACGGLDYDDDDDVAPCSDGGGGACGSTTPVCIAGWLCVGLLETRQAGSRLSNAHSCINLRVYLPHPHPARLPARPLLGLAHHCMHRPVLGRSSEHQRRVKMHGPQ